MSDTPTTTQRLNKFLAFHLGISRREADNIIEKGEVKIDGEVATLGGRLENHQTVTVHDRPVARKKDFSYIALHKPPGYVCSRRRQGETPTIYELLPKELHALKPVGRLDADSSGLLLLTDDGDFTLQMTHPRYYKQKYYEISLDNDLQPLHQQMINDFGIQLEDGPSKLTLERTSDDNRRKWRVIMSEGRNRQIRRTFSTLGYTVTSLHRTEFGKYSLSDIHEGKWKTLTIS